MGDPADLVARLRAALDGEAAVGLAILFGSAASGRMRPDSDVDVGFLPRDPGLTLDQELGVEVRLTRVVGREVDLVRLDQASTLMKWEVARRGILLYAVERSWLTRFLASAASEYIDFAPAFDRAAERFRCRLAERGRAAS